MKRLVACIVVLTLASLTDLSFGADNPATTKGALKELNDFIGEWNGSGGPAKANPASKDLWNETINWGWRFKGDDAWLTLGFKDGKHFKSGELRYLAEKKLYQMTLVDTMDKKQVFQGEYKNDFLRLERDDADKKETQRISMNLAGDGVRLIFVFERKPAERKIYTTKDYQVNYNKKGEGLAAKKSKIECVVSGGLGTMAVSFKGETFYVCCSGCRDAFNEDPEKYIKEFKAKKKQ